MCEFVIAPFLLLPGALTQNESRLSAHDAAVLRVYAIITWNTHKILQQNDRHLSLCLYCLLGRIRSKNKTQWENALLKIKNTLSVSRITQRKSAQ